MINNFYFSRLNSFTNYLFLYNERNSNSNRRFRFASNINHLRALRSFASLTDLPKPSIPPRQPFSLVFQDSDIFNKEFFESYLLNYLNPDTWYFVVAYLNYSDGDNWKNLQTNHFIHPSDYFSMEDNAKIDILHTWLISKEIKRLKESYNLEDEKINYITVYFSVIDDSISNNWLTIN